MWKNLDNTNQYQQTLAVKITEASEIVLIVLFPKMFLANHDIMLFGAAPDVYENENGQQCCW